MGKFYAEACTAVQDGKFKTAEVSAGPLEICKGEFYQALADAMSARFSTLNTGCAKIK